MNTIGRKPWDTRMAAPNIEDPLLWMWATREPVEAVALIAGPRSSLAFRRLYGGALSRSTDTWMPHLGQAQPQ